MYLIAWLRNQRPKEQGKHWAEKNFLATFNNMRGYSRGRSILFPLIIFLTCLLSCAGQERFEKKEITIQSRAGAVIINAEIARTTAQHQQGLMYRRELKDGYGMLFIFERDEFLSFWMKNTLIPLSIAYIASDGRILEIYDMAPENLNPVRSSRSVRYALEVPQGWFSRAGLGPGDMLDISRL